MLYSRPYGFIYSKNTKTASTTVEACLELLLRSEAKAGHNPFSVLDDGSIIGYRGKNYKEDPLCGEPGFCHSHMSLQGIQKVIGTLEFGRCLKISSIRNPYDRAISAFHPNGKRHPVEEISHLKQNGETSKIKDLFLKFLNKIEYDGKMHFCVKDNYQIDYMIRTESIADDLKKFLILCKCLIPMQTILSILFLTKRMLIGLIFNSFLPITFLQMHFQ